MTDLQFTLLMSTLWLMIAVISFAGDKLLMTLVGLILGGLWLFMPKR